MKIKPKILIVDDRPENLIALRTVLKDLDVELVEALSGNEALKKTLNNDFALALLDIQMPEMDGYELAKILREEEKTEHLPFIFISAVYKDNTDIFKGYEKGAFSFIPKPFQPEMLINKVKFFIDKHQQEMALIELNKDLTNTNKELAFQNEEKEKRAAELIIANKELAFQNKEKEKQEARLIASIKELAEGILKQKIAEDKTRKIAEQLKEKVRELKTVNSRLEGFAHIASHHLQEPLRKIKTFGGMLKDRYYLTLETEGQNYLDRMEYASTRMQNMINDVLTYSKVANNVSFQPCNLNTVLKDVLNDLEIIVKENNATIKVPTHMPTIEANQTQINQLFLNIIENSLKFRKSTEEPAIIISYQLIKGSEIPNINDGRRDAQFCKICILDNGIGFSNEFSKQIFLLFNRLNPETDYPGTGIGLAICETIIDYHSGFITAESKDGSGTLITFILPFKQNIEEKTRTTKTMRILIADDDADDRNLMEMAFEEIHSPINLEFAVDGENLINNLNQKLLEGQELPDLILLDMNMPKKDGRMALREIKADKELSKLNIIIFSTSKSPEDSKIAKELGASDFFTKPSDFNGMVELFTKIYKDSLNLAVN